MSPAASEPKQAIGALVDAIAEAGEASGKPAIVVAHQSLDVEAMGHTAVFVEKCWQAGIAAYPTAERAAAATAAFLRWKDERP